MSKNIIELGSAVCEHSLPLICDAFKNLPLLFEDRHKFNQVMQDTWNMQWKKFMLNFLISPWLNAKHQQFQQLPADMQIILHAVPRNAYWVFDTGMFFHGAPNSSQQQLTNNNLLLGSTFVTRVHSAAAHALSKKSAAREPQRRHRVVLVVSDSSDIACAWIELPHGSRMVLMDDHSHFFVQHFRPQQLEAGTPTLQLWALNSIVNRLRELHMTFSVAFSLKVAEVMYEAACLYIPQLHPLRPLVEFIIFQLGSLYERTIFPDATTVAAAAAESTQPSPPPEELKQVLQQFEKRVVFDEMYWDVRQRVISRTSLAEAFHPSDLHPVHNLQHALYADPALQAKRRNEPVEQVFDRMKNLQLQNGMFSMYFSERCEIESDLLRQFEKLDLSTQQNIQLRRWADHVQTSLELKTNLNSGTSSWPYTVLCMMSDLIHFSEEHHRSLSMLHPDLWNGSESDDVVRGLQRIYWWVNARQKQPTNMAVGSNNQLVKQFIMQYLVPTDGQHVKYK